MQAVHTAGGERDCGGAEPGLCVLVGQARLLARRAEIGLPIGADSLRRLADLAQRLAEIEEGRR